ncbi:MAG: PAS domain S-box protein [Bacteroidetes bacterium]|nr:MAG: PAS domain S-box protein [Bacteroidota bacterium]
MSKITLMAVFQAFIITVETHGIYNYVYFYKDNSVLFYPNLIRMINELNLILFSSIKGDEHQVKSKLNKKFTLHAFDDLDSLANHVKKFKSDLIIVDQKSGLKDYVKLRSITARHNLPIILLLNKINEEALSLSLKLGIREYILKKNLALLPAVLKNILGQLALKTKYTTFQYKKTAAGKSINSDEMLRIVTNNFPKSYVAIVDTNYIIQYAGGEEFNKNNLCPDSYMGMTVQESLKRLGKKFVNKVVEAYDKTFNGHPQTFHMKIDDQDYLYKTVPLFTDKKKIHSLLVVAENITLKLTIENNLRKAEENYRTSLSRITDGFVALDTKWRYTYMNKKAAQIFNIDPATVIGKHVCSEFDAKDAQIFHKAYKQSMREQKYKFVEEFYAPLGKWFENHIYPSPTGLSIYFRDITEKKKTDAQINSFRKKTEAAIRIGKIGFWEWDITKDEVFWSDRMFEIYGLKKGTKINYQAVINCLHPDDRAYHNKLVKEIERTKKDASMEYRVQHRNGEIRYVSVELEVICNSKGKAIKFQGTVIDHTKRVEAEKELIKSEQKYRTLVEQASDAIFIIDQKGNFKSVNSSTCKMSGYTSKELSNLSIFDLVYKKDIEKVPFKFEEVNQGLTTTSERLLKKKKGDPILVEVTSKLIEPNKILVFAKDITARKKEQTELYNSKLQFQNLIENIPGVYWVNDIKSHQTLYISPSYETIWGKKGTELYRNPSSFIESVHPEDKQKVIAAHKNISTTLFNIISYRIIKPDGSIRWIKAKANVVKSANGNLTEYGYAEDITESKKYELEKQLALQRNAQVINTMMDGFMLADRNGKIIEVNPSYCQTSGYSREELLNMTVNDLKLNKSADGRLERFDETLRERHLQFESKHIRKDGEIVNLLVSTSIMDIDGEPMCSIFYKDIDDQIKAQQKIAEYTIQLRQLTTHLQNIREEERLALSRELHDEIGQQLLAIKIDVSRLSGYIGDNEKAQKLIKDIKELIDSSVSSVRRINSELRPSLLDDIGLFATLEHQVKEFERRTNINFDFHITMDEPNLDSKISIGIFRIFQESLINVVKHAGANNVSAQLNQKNGNMELIISDNGKGFEISDGFTNKTFGLLGMKERASMMNGKLDVKSIPGKGTTLRLTVPLILS